MRAARTVIKNTLRSVHITMSVPFPGMGSENLARLGESGLQRLEEQELTAEEAEHCADDADFVDSSGSRGRILRGLYSLLLLFISGWIFVLGRELLYSPGPYTNSLRAMYFRLDSGTRP